MEKRRLRIRCRLALHYRGRSQNLFVFDTSSPIFQQVLLNFERTSIHILCTFPTLYSLTNINLCKNKILTNYSFNLYLRKPPCLCILSEHVKITTQFIPFELVVCIKIVDIYLMPQQNITPSF